VIRGYDQHHAGLVEAPHAVSLDAGCGFGGPLLAACFAPDGRLLETLEG
jgi:serine/threonine protein phosphatase 1